MTVELLDYSYQSQVFGSIATAIFPNDGATLNNFRLASSLRKYSGSKFLSHDFDHVPTVPLYHSTTTTTVHIDNWFANQLSQ